MSDRFRYRLSWRTNKSTGFFQNRNGHLTFTEGVKANIEHLVITLFQGPRNCEHVGNSRLSTIRIKIGCKILKRLSSDLLKREKNFGVLTLNYNLLCGNGYLRPIPAHRRFLFSFFSHGLSIMSEEDKDREE